MLHCRILQKTQRLVSFLTRCADLAHSMAGRWLLMAVSALPCVAGLSSGRAPLKVYDRLGDAFVARPFVRLHGKTQGGDGSAPRRLQNAECDGETLGDEVEVCVIPAMEGTETCAECYDGMDNDGDGQLDCDDADCTATMHCKNLLLNLDHFNDVQRTERVSAFAATVLAGLVAASAWALYRHVGYEAELEGHRMATEAAASGSRAAGCSGLAQSLTASLSDAVPGSVSDGSETEPNTMRLDIGNFDYWIQAQNQDAKAANWNGKPKMKKQVLTDVSASFLPGTLTAVMGPSGCGKTVLLNQLSGRAKVGEFRGVRAVNGEVMAMQRFAEVMQRQAYVRQEDTHFEGLTVRETMMYSAMLALPESTAMSAKIRRVEHVIEEVGLDICADALVGGIQFKGISGGQKRRLSIAIELLRAPSIIMLDEPTSGLDATTSLKLVWGVLGFAKYCSLRCLSVLRQILTLSKLAKQGQRAMIATIHQPRAEIFAAFDNLLLLGQEGAVIFFGPAKDCVAHLAGARAHGQ